MTRRVVPTLIVLLVVLSATIAAGCIGGSTPTTTFTESYPTDTFSETSSVDNSYSTSSGKNVPADAIKVYVIKVIDGDTY